MVVFAIGECKHLQAQTGAGGSLHEALNAHDVTTTWVMMGGAIVFVYGLACPYMCKQSMRVLLPAMYPPMAPKLFVNVPMRTSIPRGLIPKKHQ